MKSSSRGFSLVELIVVVAAVAIIAAASMPFLGDYSVNSRLREGGNQMLADALYAQSEALKRNSNVTLEVTTTSMRVFDVTTGETLRNREFPNGVMATTRAVTFGGTGRPAVFGDSAEVDLSMASTPCSDQYRCPRLIVSGGGGVRLCSNQLNCSTL